MAPVLFFREGVDVGVMLGVEAPEMVFASAFPERAVGVDEGDVDADAVALGFTVVSLPSTNHTPFPCLQQFDPSFSNPQQ